VEGKGRQKKKRLKKTGRVEKKGEMQRMMAWEIVI